MTSSSASNETSRAIRLVAASLDAPAGLETFLREVGEGESGFGGELQFISGEKSLPELLASLVEAADSKGLPEGWVPATTSWLLNGEGEVIGMSRLRHSLTPFLLEKGGQIGYFIKKSERGKRLGTAILSETLRLARNQGMQQVLIAAFSDNLPSLRVIEANGGVLEDERQAASGHYYRRYWIALN